MKKNSKYEIDDETLHSYIITNNDIHDSYYDIHKHITALYVLADRFLDIDFDSECIIAASQDIIDSLHKLSSNYSEMIYNNINLGKTMLKQQY